MNDTTKTEPREPVQVKKWPKDILLNSDAIWCSFKGGEPFENTICLAKHAENKRGIWLMLDSHNFLFCPDGKKVSVVERTREPEEWEKKYIKTVREYIGGPEKSFWDRWEQLQFEF